MNQIEEEDSKHSYGQLLHLFSKGVCSQMYILWHILANKGIDGRIYIRIDGLIKK